MYLFIKAGWEYLLKFGTWQDHWLPQIFEVDKKNTGWNCKGIKAPKIESLNDFEKQKPEKQQERK